MTDQQRFFVIWLRTVVTVSIILLAAMIVTDQYGEPEEFEFVPVGPTITAQQ